MEESDKLDEKIKQFRARLDTIQQLTWQTNLQFVNMREIYRCKIAHPKAIELAEEFFHSIYYISFFSICLSICNLFEKNDKPRNNPCEGTYILFSDIKKFPKCWENLPERGYNIFSGLENQNYHMENCSAQKIMEKMETDVEAEKDVLSKFRIIRNKSIAHVDKKTIESFPRFAKENSVSLEDMERLLTLNFNLCNVMTVILEDANTLPIAITPGSLESLAICTEMGLK